MINHTRTIVTGKQKYKLKDNNDIATKAIRLCLERVRKLTGKSVKHWFITELGHEKTERLHLHGIVWGLGNGKKVTDNWKYGITFTGYFVNEKTINYITKYMLKIDGKRFIKEHGNEVFIQVVKAAG